MGGLQLVTYVAEDFLQLAEACAVLLNDEVIDRDEARGILFTNA